MFKVFATKRFLKKYKKAPPEEKRRLDKAKEQLKRHPFSGKPLGYPFFREKKIEGKRMYYTVYKEKQIVLVIAYGRKKGQQETINAIKAMLQQYKKEVEKLENSLPLLDSSSADVFKPLSDLVQQIGIDFFQCLKAVILSLRNRDGAYFFHFISLK